MEKRTKFILYFLQSDGLYRNHFSNILISVKKILKFKLIKHNWFISLEYFTQRHTDKVKQCSLIIQLSLQRTTFDFALVYNPQHKKMKTVPAWKLYNLTKYVPDISKLEARNICQSLTELISGAPEKGLLTTKLAF